MENFIGDYCIVQPSLTDCVTIDLIAWLREGLPIAERENVVVIEKADG